MLRLVDPGKMKNVVIAKGVRVEGENEVGRVKIIDRRRFTPDGEPREPDGPASPPPPDSQLATAEPGVVPEVTQSTAMPATARQGEPNPPGVKLPPKIFQEVVNMLVEYAMAFLTGQVPGVERNPLAGRLFVDLLAEVQRRCQSQLTLQEAKVMDDVLFQLRTRFLATSS